MLGWLEATIGVLDSIPLSGSDRHVTLWSVLRSLFTVSAFVVVSVWVARQVERRVHGLTDLAQSTRIGVTKFSTAMLIGLGGLLGLSASGLDLTALTVFSGAIGLGLGFGLQAIAANFVIGFVLPWISPSSPATHKLHRHAGTLRRLGWYKYCAALCGCATATA